MKFDAMILADLFASHTSFDPCIIIMDLFYHILLQNKIKIIEKYAKYTFFSLMHSLPVYPN